MNKNKKQNISFKLLSKRAFAVAMSVALLGSTASLLTACDDGATGQNGKSAYELAVENGYTGTLEEWIASLNGSNGDAGTDGIGAYVGYDGYIWNGAEKTARKTTQTLYDKSVVESTMEITKEMSNYYVGSYLDISTNRIALMANYLPNTKVTRYSGLKITTIKLVAEKSGSIYIGTAKVADVVGVRKNGGNYASTTSAYTVVAGENTIALNLEVGNDETIVIGGSSSVGIYVANGIPTADEVGNFAVLDGKSNIELLNKTNGYDDTLAIETKADFIIEGRIFEDVLTTFPESEISESASVSFSAGPFAYQDTTYFAGKKITNIGIPVKTVTAIDENQTFTMFRIKQTTTSSFASNYVEKYTLTLPVEALQDATYDDSNSVYNVNKWVYVDLTGLGIELADDESLAFSQSSDSVVWGYRNSGATSKYNFYTNTGRANQTIYFDITYESATTIEDHLEQLLNNENNA